MRLPEAAFNGLDKPQDTGCYDCVAIWKQTDRDGLALSIAQAEEMRERELSYHVAPKYIVDEEQEYKYPTILTRKHLIAIGEKTTSDILLGAVINLGVETAPNDPVILTVATTVTVVGEIKVFQPGCDVEIHPSSITIAGGFATIKIPRSRLVDPSIDLNCEPAPDYYENDNFLTAVDVKRVYTDPSDAAHLVWFGSCSGGTISLSEVTQLCYARIRDYRLAVVEPISASYNGSTWSYASAIGCRTPKLTRISYLSGIRSSIYTELITAALAHTLLPNIIPDRVNLCSGCWKNDQLPDPSKDITPYGSATGAIKAWIADSRAKVGQGGKFPAMRR